MTPVILLTSNHNHMLFHAGERLSEGDIDTLLQGMEDNSGKVNYEGKKCRHVLKGVQRPAVFVIVCFALVGILYS